VHGQALYIDPKAEMVIARFGSAPWAGNVFLDPTSLPAFRAMAEHLLHDLDKPESVPVRAAP
jgi:hypothetical protein